MSAMCDRVECVSASSAERGLRQLRFGGAHAPSELGNALATTLSSRQLSVYRAKAIPLWLSSLTRTKPKFCGGIPSRVTGTLVHELARNGFSKVISRDF
jgi:hypothetical protein